MQRPEILQALKNYFKSHLIVAILGPRQCGKTTVARMYCKTESHFPQSNYFDLESAVDVERLSNPERALTPLKGLIVIDEIQRLPDLFPTLRVLVDKENCSQQFLILGSASRELIRQSSESLAGRIAYIELTPFSFKEVYRNNLKNREFGKEAPQNFDAERATIALGQGASEHQNSEEKPTLPKPDSSDCFGIDHLEQLWLRGGFPRSYLAKTDEESKDWRTFYIRTFLEQDIPNLGIKIAPDSLRRFWTMLAHYHGNIFNAAELGRSFGASDNTMRHYLDILVGTFMIRQLSPWHQNLGKRQVKSPKIYFRDSGIFHALLNIFHFDALYMHPKIGASWEGFALEEVIRAHHARQEECYFWSTYGGAELDLVIDQSNMLKGFEFKYADAPKLTKSMHSSLEDLELSHLYVIYPGTIDYSLSDKITVVGLTNYLKSL